jgi:hypothetical protein
MTPATRRAPIVSAALKQLKRSDDATDTRLKHRRGIVQPSGWERSGRIER